MIEFGNGHKNVRLSRIVSFLCLIVAIALIALTEFAHFYATLNIGKLTDIAIVIEYYFQDIPGAHLIGLAFFFLFSYVFFGYIEKRLRN